MPTKFGRGLWIFALLVVAVLSWQLIDDRNVRSNASNGTIEMAVNESDYYLEDFEIINITNQVQNDSNSGNGSGRYFRITGRTLSHHFPEGHSTIENPSVRMRTPTTEFWHANARTGRMSADFKVLDLNGDVNIKHDRLSDKAPITVDTESIRIDTAKRMMSTEDPVVVKSTGWSYQANSMQAEVDKGILSFTSGVKGQYASDQK